MSQLPRAMAEKLINTSGRKPWKYLFLHAESRNVHLLRRGDNQEEFEDYYHDGKISRNCQWIGPNRRKMEGQDKPLRNLLDYLNRRSRWLQREISSYQRGKVEKPDELVVDAHSRRCWNQHSEDQPRALEIGRPRWGDPLHSVEDDVRYETETARATHQRWAPETRKAKRVYEGPPWNGLLPVQVQLICIICKLNSSPKYIKWFTFKLGR